eukprot:508586-Pyramimonas_sp.AAC.2
MADHQAGHASVYAYTSCPKYRNMHEKPLQVDLIQVRWCYGCVAQLLCSAVAGSLVVFRMCHSPRSPGGGGPR